MTGADKRCDAARYSPTGQPACVHTLEYATNPSGAHGAVGRQLSWSGHVDEDVGPARTAAALGKRSRH